MNYATIKRHDISNGPGVRVSLFVSGCTRHCPNCFNPETWDFAYGEPCGQAVIDSLLASLAPSYIRGFSLLGGEPMEPANQTGVLEIARQVRERFPDKSIWCYSGYLFEQLRDGSIGDGETVRQLLALLDVLVDGPFVEELKNPALRFRGSSNQRIIDVPASLQRGEVVLWDDARLSEV